VSFKETEIYMKRKI